MTITRIAKPVGLGELEYKLAQHLHLDHTDQTAKGLTRRIVEITKTEDPLFTKVKCASKMITWDRITHIGPVPSWEI